MCEILHLMSILVIEQLIYGWYKVSYYLFFYFIFCWCIIWCLIEISFTNVNCRFVCTSTSIILHSNKFYASKILMPYIVFFTASYNFVLRFVLYFYHYRIVVILINVLIFIVVMILINNIPFYTLDVVKFFLSTYMFLATL